MYENELEEYRNAEPWAQPQNRAVVVHPSVHPGVPAIRPPIAPAYPPGYPMLPPGYSAYPPGYPFAPSMTSPKTLRTIGLVVDLVGQAIAAVMPLPAKPTMTGTSATDEANMTLYQEALAKHAKSDERIRTLVKVIREALDLKAAP